MNDDTPKRKSTISMNQKIRFQKATVDMTRLTFETALEYKWTYKRLNEIWHERLPGCRFHDLPKANQQYVYGYKDALMTNLWRIMEYSYVVPAIYAEDHGALAVRRTLTQIRDMSNSWSAIYQWINDNASNTGAFVYPTGELFTDPDFSLPTCIIPKDKRKETLPCPLNVSSASAT